MVSLFIFLLKSYLVLSKYQPRNLYPSLLGSAGSMTEFPVLTFLISIIVLSSFINVTVYSVVYIFIMKNAIRNTNTMPKHKTILFTIFPFVSKDTFILLS